MTSTHGFGVDVGNPLRRKAFRLFQPIADFPSFFFSTFNALLMLLPTQISFLLIDKGCIKPAALRRVPACGTFLSLFPAFHCFNKLLRCDNMAVDVV